MTFNDFEIKDVIKKALKECGYENPSPIQEQAIPELLNGRDILATAKTGSGKTCAFMVPIINEAIDIKNNKIKALVLTPTRELAIQIHENCVKYAKYSKLKSLAIFGGVKEGRQKEVLRGQIDILIATPGRLLDFIHQGVVNLKDISFLVLDEADRMLDMGFINDVKKILKFVPQKRQTLLFSATMPQDIVKLCDTILNNPVRIEIDDKDKAVDKVTQRAYYVDKDKKSTLLYELLKDNSIFRALVFTRTKHGADKLAQELLKRGITSDAIHGNKSQNARQKALKDFKSSKIQALVATDIAARGIDIDDLEAVINYDLPDTSETYVHRIGRTARRGKDGLSISFVSIDEVDMLHEIERKCKITLEVQDNTICPMQNFKKSEKKEAKKTRRRPSTNTHKINEDAAKPKAKPSKNKFKSKNIANNKNKSIN